MTETALTHRTCDRCGAVAEFKFRDVESSGKQAVWAKIVQFENTFGKVSRDIGDMNRPADLCPACSTSFQEWWNAKGMA